MELKEAIKTLDKILNNVISRTIPVGQKIGLYYSGGVDSSLVSTYYNFEKITYNENDPKLQEQYKKEFNEKFPDIIKVIGRPIKSFSPFAWWKLGETAKRLGCTTVFSGESADELFGGYVRWLPEQINMQAQKMFPSYKSMFPASRDVNEVGKEAFYGDLQFLMEAERKIAKHHGLNIVFPFDDQEVIDFAWSLPPEFKINGFETKVILRRLLEQRDPNYKHIEKHGLFCSVNFWLGVPEEGYNKTTYLKLQNKILYGKR